MLAAITLVAALAQCEAVFNANHLALTKSGAVGVDHQRSTDGSQLFVYQTGDIRTIFVYASPTMSPPPRNVPIKEIGTCANPQGLVFKIYRGEVELGVKA